MDFANSSLGHSVALGPVQRSVGPALTFRKFGTQDAQSRSSGMAAAARFTVAPFICSVVGWLFGFQTDFMAGALGGSDFTG